jgi:predicted MFS family arabinose efflux permease
MGLTQMAMSLGFAVGPWAGTAVLERFGGNTLWLGCFALGIAATAMMLRLPEDASVRSKPAGVPV